MLGRPRESLRQLIRTQHGEFMQYQESRDRYQERRDRYEERRDAEFQARNKEFRAYVEESRAARAESDRLHEELREFTRELLLRNEKVYKAVIAEVEEGRKQIQANTQAVLSVLDRLDGRDAS